jgi:hypothetical protein
MDITIAIYGLCPERITLKVFSVWLPLIVVSVFATIIRTGWFPVQAYVSTGLAALASW